MWGYGTPCEHCTSKIVKELWGWFTYVWTKWFMTKVVANEWVRTWCYEVCALMSSDELRCYDLLNTICPIKDDILGSLGMSIIVGCYLCIALVWLGGFLRWWFLCEGYVLWYVYDVVVLSKAKWSYILIWSQGDTFY